MDGAPIFAGMTAPILKICLQRLGSEHKLTSMNAKASQAKTGCKLSGEERRVAILRAVRRVFAEKGFDGTTTRELAVAAGVSEALLFKHFPNKETLFSAMKLSLNEQDLGRLELLKGLDSSVSTLVLMVHFLVSRLIEGFDTCEDEPAIQTRLMLRSLAQDGEFARLSLRRVANEWVPKVAACLEAAVAAGEAFETPVCPNLGAWFTQHLALLVSVVMLPATAAVDYGATRRKLVEQVVWFCLRGMGIKEDAIRRYYNPLALELIQN
jgi:AcrR family transcriptional regulator